MRQGRIWRIITGCAAAAAAVTLCFPPLGGASAQGTGNRVTLQLDNSRALVNDAPAQILAADGTPQAPLMRDGRTMLPLRWLAGQLGLTLTWDGQAQTATLTDGARTAVFPVDRNELTLDGAVVPLDAPMTLIGGAAYVPARAAAEAFGWQAAYVPPEAGGLVFLADADEPLQPGEIEIGQALTALGPSHLQLLQGGLLLRVGSDFAVADGSRVQLTEGGASVAPKTADGYYWLPLEACARAFGMTADGAALTAPDGTVSRFAEGAVTRGGTETRDERFRLRTEDGRVYVTMQAFAAACGLTPSFPNADTMALTRTGLYGYPDQTAYAAAVAGQLPRAHPVGSAYIALTFDDGPTGGSSGLTARLLDGLKARGAHATFFLCGYRVQDFHTHMERYLAEGHELGNHTMNHPLKFATLSGDKIAGEVDRNSTLIASYTGQRPTVMRPVGGAVSDGVRAQMKKLGLPVVNWSVDTLDWKYRDAARIRRVIVEQAKDGDIVLMHDLHQPTVDGVLAAIDELQKQGYAFVTVSELAELKGAALEPGKVYTRFP